MHPYRTHTCGELRQSHVGQTPRLSGWVHRVRDHGGILFIDLRDHYGITQVIADPGSPAFVAAESLRAEWVVRIDGEVRMRPEGTVNPDLATGDIEVVAGAIEVLSEASELPLPVFGEQEYPEDVRLRYRFLDLRRERMHRNIKRRIEIIDWIRRRMTADGFLEFQTPILTASSPEGARDYLVPARRYPGKFYALPQAPQQFKQLIMVAGFDRYFQIAPCFRDEDARADRSPGEFYQIDIEMSFVTQDDVFAAVEPVLRDLFEAYGGGAPVTQKFPRIAYGDALLRYGTDKPDLRNPIHIADVTEEFQAEGVTFDAFRNLIAKGAVVRAIPAPDSASQPRSFFDKLNDWARKEMQAPGLAYLRFVQTADVAPATDEMLQDKAGWRLAFQHVIGKGPIANYVPHEVQLEMAWKARLKPGEALFFACDKGAAAAALAGAARLRIGDELGLADKTRFDFCWIVDFPMYEWNDEDKKIDFSHNPFSMPQGGLEALESKDPLDVLAFQYDIVCNGIELSSGAIRNHRPDIMRKAFEIAGYGEDVLAEKFGGLYRAFHYGAPPHGGIAPGLDRIVMMLCGEQNLREVVLFPMNQQAEDPLLGAPSEASPKQLRELHIRPIPPVKAKAEG